MQENNDGVQPNVTCDFYHNYFLMNYKLSFGYPRSDTYQTCDRLQNLIVAETDEVLKNKFEAEKLLHVSKSDYYIIVY